MTRYSDGKLKEYNALFRDLYSIVNCVVSPQIMLLFLMGDKSYIFNFGPWVSSRPK